MGTVVFALFMISVSLMVVGWLSPDALQPLLRRRLSRRRAVGIFGGAALGLFLIFAFITEPPEPVAIPSGVIEDGAYRVVDVIDGDTIAIERNGVRERVRLIGIDAPETNHPERAPECYGQEASERVEELLAGETVQLEIDLSQANRDRYERLLRHVYLDGENIGEVLIVEGYAYAYTFEEEHEYEAEFRAAEVLARDADAGLWDLDTCDGQRELDTGPAPEGMVKMSVSGICHGPGTTYYEITTNYTPYDSLQECLDAGGRLPQR